MSENALAQLESRVVRVVQLLRSLQTENRSLREEIQQLRKDLEEIKEDKKIKNQRIEQFEDDRLRIRSRVEKIMRKVRTLEEPRES
ncbi:hypothetical protein MYX84_04925 [Acidobacteria bacterium AH-259-O06]|nr:hypothetical protein [Acidobacteria bacterium AH-259-O06]